jgi:acyl transferase domain-containing protein/acyl carrier protein
MDTPDLRGWLISATAALSGRHADAIQTGESFAALGLDSAQLAGLAGQIEEVLGESVEPSVIFENPTIDTLARALTRQHPSEADPADGGEAASGGTAAEPVPVAVTGLACRMPGADDAAAYWRLMTEGRDAVGEVPPGRWDDVPADAVRHGGYLDDVAGFDSRFFRISAEEADRMDPQQRLLLEVCWEALEDVGELPPRLRGSPTGTFVGVSTAEYMRRQTDSPETMSQHTVTSCAPAVIAGRLAYLLDLRGPALAVDTACSSSLVAVHLAVRAIRSGECTVAVAAGVNVMLDPEVSVGLSRAGMLASDGRCKAFDERADGYVRGEGCGAVVLKPLPAALAAGDRVYAVIRGSAINSDGASNGLTAPNPSAQRAVLAAAYRDARMSPATVDYVECHGTGTLLGDQIEAGALGAVMGRDRPAGTPCLIGSVKTNIGHLEAAAGIAGLIKTCLVLYHGVVPPSLHFERPNPRIAFERLGLQVVTQPHPLDDPAIRPSRAGVSSFGFSGTNAHVVLESVEAIPPQSTAGPVVLPLSARTADSLERLRHATARLLQQEPGSAAEIAYTASVRRMHYRPYRLAAAAPSAMELAGQLATAPALQGVSAGEPRILFVFSGQGTQRPGTGRELAESEPLFASTIRRCDEIVADELGWSIEGFLNGTATDTDVTDTAVAQPVTVAVQVGLARLLGGYGIIPAAVVGHSVGEISAAVVAGLLDLGTGLRLAARRGRAMAGPEGEGSMLAVGLTPDEAARLTSTEVWLAAVNAPGNCVLSGDPAVLTELRGKLAAEGIFARSVAVRYAFHSGRMTKAAQRFAASLRDFQLSPSDGHVPMYSTVSGRRATADELDAGYWCRGVLNTVRFADAVAAAAGEAGGFAAAVELGGHPDLGASLRAIAGNQRFAVLHTLQRGANDGSRLLALLSELYALGSTIRWEQRYPRGGRVVSLPPYPWQRERHWMDRSPAFGRGDAGSLLGRHLELAGAGTRAWENVLSPGTQPALADHRVAGAAVLPATAYAALAVQAAVQAGMPACTVKSLELHRAMLLDHGSVRVQTSLTPVAEGFDFAVHGKAPGPGDWTVYAMGQISAAPPAPPALDMSGAQLRCLENIPLALFYRLLADQGLEYGAAFRALLEVWRCDGEAIGTIATRDENRLTEVVVLDAAAQLVAAVAARPGEAGVTAGRSVPVRAEAVTIWAPLKSAARVHAVLRSADERSIVADLTVVDADDRPCARVDGLLVRRSGSVPHPVRGNGSGACRYQLAWRPLAVEGAENSHGRWLILGNGRGVAEQLAGQLIRSRVQVLQPSAAADNDHESVEQLVDQYLPLDGVVCLWPLDPQREDLAWLPTAVARLVRAVSFAAQGECPRLLVATRGAQPVDRAVLDVPAATVWGLLRCAPIENPVLWAACVDLDPDGSAAEDAGALCREITAPTALTVDTQVGYRGGRRFVQRITPVAPITDRGALRLDENSAYVITGGTGRLGRLAAGLLLERGAGTVALLSRSAEEGKSDAERLLPYRVDVSDRVALADTLRRLRSRGQPIRGVIHAAGVLADGPLLELSPAAIRTVLAGKAAGAAYLDELTDDDPLDWFVLYSSAASVLGSPGQANYAAANAYIDVLAHRRIMRGRPAQVINWGPWARVGMAAETGFMAGPPRPHGIVGPPPLREAASALDPADGLVQLEQLILDGRAQTVVLPFDLEHLAQFYPTSVGASFFTEVTSEQVRALKSIGTSYSARPDLAQPYVAPSNVVERRIAAIWQRSLGIEPIGVHDSFFEFGGDSVLGNQILIEINRAINVTIDPEEAFKDFTISHLAELADACVLEQLEHLTDDEAARLLDSVSDPCEQPEQE